MTVAEGESRSLYLTDRGRVGIDLAHWRRIASATGDSYEHEDYAIHMQALHRCECDQYELNVWQSTDGRVLVEGIFVAGCRGEDYKGGAELEKGESIPAAVRSVGEECGFPDRTIRRCIGALPVEDLGSSAPQAPSEDTQWQSAPIAGLGVLSHAERMVLDQLRERGLPYAAASYEQALRDIAQPNRSSWRGVAAELREVLREVIDHLATDEQVMASPGLKLEEKQKRPTQTQKVLFALRARHCSDVIIHSAEQALLVVEETIAKLARSTYQRGSISTHKATGENEILSVKGYVDALLVDLLRRA